MQKDTKMNVHFYWSGDKWQFLNRLTIISHILVGHQPIIHLHGERPNSIYWVDDITDVLIQDANEIFDTTKLIEKGVDIRTTSDKFSYYLVKKTGEYYADTDAIALLPWPDQEIVLATYDPEVINVGVFRFPKDHPVLDECIKTHIPTWGNVRVFTKVVRDYGLDYNVDHDVFYPIHCGQNTSSTMNCHGRILDPVELPDGCVSYHYWSNKVHKVGINHIWLDKPELHEDSLFRLLCEWIFEEYSHTNERENG